jgi:hypothetical protein
VGPEQARWTRIEQAGKDGPNRSLDKTRVVERLVYADVFELWKKLTKYPLTRRTAKRIREGEKMYTLRVALLSAVLSVGTVGCNPTSPDPGNQGGTPLQVPNQLVTKIASESQGQPKSDSRILRQRFVNLNRDVLTTVSESTQRQTTAENERERTFSMELFDDASFTAVVDNFELSSTASKILSGHLVNVEGSFSIVFDDDGILGTIRVPSKGTFRLLTIGNKTASQQLDPTKFKRPGDPLRSPSNAPAQPLATPDDGAVIDLLVLYTPAARDAAAIAAGHSAGTTADIEKRIVACNTETNNAYTRSGITTKLNVAHRAFANYDGDKNGLGLLKTILGDLTKKGDGKLDDAHTLRDTHKADLVLLLVVDNNEGGLAWGMDNTNNNAGFEKSAFGVVAWDDALDGLAYSHEVGHIQGCDHDRSNTTTRGVYDYSFGYRYICDTKQYYTIMAYGPGEMVPYFSNAAVKFPNVCPTGVAEGQPDPCEEWKTINNTRKLVANFRPRVP